MKIGIVGAGAMGCVYAALMADAGNEVWAIDTWQAHVDAIAANGLRLEGASGDRTVALGATTDPANVGPCDLVIVATKAPQVEVAAAGARALLGPKTPVLTIQNGLGSAARVARILGEERVIVGVVGGFGASIVAPGHAHHNGMELVGPARRTAVTQGSSASPRSGGTPASGSNASTTSTSSSGRSLSATSATAAPRR